jgi:hypothetical protein
MPAASIALAMRAFSSAIAFAYSFGPAAHRLDAGRGELLLCLGHLRDRDDLRGDLVDDAFRRSGRREDADDRREVESGNYLGDGRTSGACGERFALLVARSFTLLSFTKPASDG